jgi:hypothetical protein
MTANFLQFQEDGHEIWITIPPKVEHDKDGGYVEANETKVVSLNNLYSAAVDRNHQVGGGAGEDLPSSKLPFVWKLYEMLEDVESAKQEDIVSWVRNGKAFKVHQLETFVDTIIPKYCKLSKYKSFQRQLYFYGFTRILSGPDQGGYHHPKFVRGKKTLCLSMTPKNNSRRRRRSSASSTATKSSMNQAAQQVATSMERPASPSSSVSTTMTRGQEEEDEEKDMTAAKPEPLVQSSTSAAATNTTTMPASAAAAVPQEIVVDEQPWDSWIVHELQDLLLEYQGSSTPTPTANEEPYQQQHHDHDHQQDHQQSRHQQQQHYYDERWEEDHLEYAFDDMPFHSVEDVRTTP